MHFKMLLLTSLILGGCTTAPKPPVISKITFLSMKPAIVEDWIVMGDYHAESFEVEGYKIQFKSVQEIAPENEGNFINLDFYECDSSERYEDGNVYSARDYKSFSNSQAIIIERKLDGSFIYEAQLMSEQLERVEPPICAKIFVLFFIAICSFFLASCASSGGSVAPETIKNVKYFQTKPYDPEPGVEYVRLTALVSGRLNIKNDCLMIGPHVPVFSNDLVIARDRRGLFIQHETGGKKFRIGQKITGGGGYSSQFFAKPDFVSFKNGANVEACKPQTYRWLGERETGSYVSFYLSDT